MVRRALARGHGGRILTPNVDILRQARRRRRGARRSSTTPTLVVADGMPLVWASRLAGTPLPERVAGSSLIWSLSAGLAADGRSIFVLGGDAGARSAPTRAARPRLGSPRYPGLRVAGTLCPAYGFDRDPASCTPTLRPRSSRPSPTWSSSASGFPKQERVIARLRGRAAAQAWFLGCGVAVNFVAGDGSTGRRAGCSAPGWSGRTGWAPSPAGWPAATCATTPRTPCACSP